MKSVVSVVVLLSLVLPLTWELPARGGDEAATPSPGHPSPSPAPGITSEPPTPAPWSLTLELGTTAVSANNVLPAPIAIGAGLLLERQHFGIEAAIHVDGATLCDNASGGDGSCGPLWIGDIAPRFSLTPASSFSPYVSARVQLMDSRRHGLVPAAGPRLGLRYRGKSIGAYVEAGPSFVTAADGAFGQFVSSRRWFPQASAGATFSLW